MKSAFIPLCAPNVTKVFYVAEMVFLIETNTIHENNIELALNQLELATLDEILDYSPRVLLNKAKFTQEGKGMLNFGRKISHYENSTK